MIPFKFKFKFAWTYLHSLKPLNNCWHLRGNWSGVLRHSCGEWRWTIIQSDSWRHPANACPVNINYWVSYWGSYFWGRVEFLGMVIDFFFFCLLISLHELGILIDLLIYWRQYKTLKLSVSLSLSLCIPLFFAWQLKSNWSWTFLRSVLIDLGWTD